MNVAKNVLMLITLFISPLFIGWMCGLDIFIRGPAVGAVWLISIFLPASWSFMIGFMID